MDKTKNILLKLLHPHPVVICLLSFCSVVGLVYIFTQNAENEFYAPILYALSFYALCIVTARFIPAVKNIKKVLHRNKHTSRYLSEADLRARISMHTGTIVNIGFAAFKFSAGIYYKSVWFMAVALYYLILSVIRFTLITRDKKSSRLAENRISHQWKSYRLCGYLLFLLNFTMSGMAFLMIWQNEAFSYPGFVIYASAAYTFYRLIIAIVRLSRQKHGNAVLLAAKALDLSISLMSLFSLQTAMFNAFGADTTEATRTLMNILTGSAVCFAVVCIAVIMIIKSNKQLKKYLRRI